MNVNILNSMAVGMVFMLVAGALVVLAAMIGDLLCRVTQRRSSIHGRFACAGDPPHSGRAGHSGRDGTTAVCDNWGVRGAGNSGTGICEENSN